jgi:hypothetical protein
MDNSESMEGLSVQTAARGDNSQVYSSIIQWTVQWCLTTSMALETMPNVHLTWGGVCTYVWATQHVDLCSSWNSAGLTDSKTVSHVAARLQRDLLTCNRESRCLSCDRLIKPPKNYFSREYSLVRHLSMFNILSFPQEYPVAAYVSFLVFPSILFLFQ